jgi:mannose-6-phosphate isomerase-like protein (cupin superfamily)
MRHIRTSDFKGIRPWDALPLGTIDGTSVKLHWTDAPYPWHVNDGEEVFFVVEGTVHMRYRIDGTEREVVLEAGDAFMAHSGDAHMAIPQGACRVLVVERIGSA